MGGAWMRLQFGEGLTDQCRSPCTDMRWIKWKRELWSCLNDLQYVMFLWWRPAQLPINDEALIRSLLVTHRTDPGGFLLIHLQVEGSIETLQMGARHSPAWHHQSHLTQLQDETKLRSGRWVNTAHTWKSGNMSVCVTRYRFMCQHLWRM